MNRYRSCSRTITATSGHEVRSNFAGRLANVVPHLPDIHVNPVGLGEVAVIYAPNYTSPAHQLNTKASNSNYPYRRPPPGLSHSEPRRWRRPRQLRAWRASLQRAVLKVVVVEREGRRKPVMSRDSVMYVCPPYTGVVTLTWACSDARNYDRCFSMRGPQRVSTPSRLAERWGVWPERDEKPLESHR